MNIAVFMGRLTEDPTLRYTNNGKPILPFTVASNVGYGDNKQTNFFKCKLWGKPAESMSKYLVKGKPVLVVAEAQPNNWTSNDGVNHRDTNYFVKSVEFLLPDNTGGNNQKSNTGSSREFDDLTDPEPKEYNDDIPF